MATGVGRVSRRPALTHSLWLIVLLKLVTPPLVPLAIPRTSAVMPTAPPVDNASVERDSGPVAWVEPTVDDRAGDVDTSPEPEPILSAAFASVDEVAPALPKASGEVQSDAMEGHEVRTSFGLPAGWTWEQTTLAAIVLGALAWWTLAALRIVQFQRLLRDMRPATEELQFQTDELAERVGLNVKPVVCLVPGHVPPMLWAIGRQPRLLVPAELWAMMGPDEQTSLLLHELAHLKRRDHWVRWLELVVAGLYWWHPVVWWARRALREAEEQCCDAWVVWAMPRRARTYAAALLAAVEFVSGARTAPAVASATSGSGHFSSLKRRLQMIVRAKTPKSLSWAGRFGVLGTAALLLPLAPSWAQSDRSEDRKEALPAQIAEEFSRDPEVQDLINRLTDANQWLDRARQHASAPTDPAVVALRRDVAKLNKQYQRLWEDNYASIRDRLHRAMRIAHDDELLALKSSDDDKDKVKFKDDDPDKDVKDDKEVKARDTAERLQEQLEDLVGKVGKQFGPVTEEIRKALGRAVEEVHKSLEKENVSLEDLGKALEKSQEELRKSFEGGGAVNRELREAFEQSRKELEETIDRSKAEVHEQVEALRGKSRELTEQARENLERAKDVAEKDALERDQGPPNRDELEATRREIRELEQALRRSTRRLEELQRRECAGARHRGASATCGDSLDQNRSPRRQRNPPVPRHRPSPRHRPRPKHRPSRQNRRLRFVRSRPPRDGLFRQLDPAPLAVVRAAGAAHRVTTNGESRSSKKR